MMRAQFAKQARGVLARLYDPVALADQPLSRLLLPRDSAGQNPQEVTLVRDRLIAAIEDLKPGSQVDQTAKAWRPYRVLQLRYIEARDAVEVRRRLALSKSQYYREHAAALASLVETLWEQGRAAAGTPRTESRRPASAGGERPAASSIGSPQPRATLSLYAGTGETGHRNGPARLARFAGPLGLTLESDGTLYVADTGNHRIRSVTTTGLVLDIAGSGTDGYADGPSASAQFSSPNIVTVGPDGTVYVGDTGNLRIRAISPSGLVSTLAGSGVAGCVDGFGTAAQFTSTGALVADPAGNLYAPDRLNNVIRRITPAGLVSTFAGSGTRGHLDGPPKLAQFNLPQRMAADATGNIYVVDIGDNRIRKIAPDGAVSTVAGTGVPGFADGPVGQATFSSNVRGIALDTSGNLYVMDAGNRRIRVVSPNGMVSTLFEFTNPDQAPGNIKVDRAGNLYLSDREHNVIYRLSVPQRS